MKKILLLPLLVLFMLGCGTDDDPANGQLVSGTWNLTKITNTSVGGSITPDPDNTHYYEISNNGTFKRIQIEDGTTDELEGTYTVSDESVYFGNEDGSIQKFIELTYTSEATFFSCGILDANKQLLILTSDNKLENNLGGPCDGENYEYTRENTRFSI